MRLLPKICLALVVMLGLVTVASAQYLISARAGLVNYVDGKATVKHQNGKTEEVSNPFQLEKGDEVEAQGRMEILLNPGSVLRLERGSLVKVSETRFTAMRFDLKFGAVSIEATEIDRKGEATLEIGTPQGTIKILKNGIYNISALPTGATIVSVRKGKSELLTADGKKKSLKSGRRFVVDNTLVAESKLDKSLDGFERWSERRAEQMAVLNYKLRRPDSWPLDRLSSWNYSGFWYYDTFNRSYCYLPFSSRYRSPFGFYYWNFFDPYYWGSPYYGGDRRTWAGGGNNDGGGGAVVNPGNRGGNNGNPGNAGGGNPTTNPPPNPPEPDVRRRPPTEEGPVNSRGRIWEGRQDRGYPDSGFPRSSPGSGSSGGGSTAAPPPPPPPPPAPAPSADRPSARDRFESRGRPQP